MLTGVICPLLPPNCQSSYNVLTCTVCNPGYLLLDSTNCYSQNITNCPAGSLPYNDSNLKTSYCKPLPIRNCQSINKLSAVCDSCFTDYQLLNGICLKTTIITPCVKGVCDCSKGYLFNDFCYVIPLNNCLFSYNNFICDVCADKYTLDGNDCAPLLKANDPGCIELDETKTVCKTCKITYVMNPSNLCVFNFQICSQKNCQQSDCPANF